MKHLLDIFLKILPRILPLLIVVFEGKWRIIFAVVYTLIAGLYEYTAVIRPERKMRARIQKVFDSHFKPWVEKARHNRLRPSIRINVMQVSSWRFRLYQRICDSVAPAFLIRWIEPRFEQVYEYNMSGHPDANFGLRVSSGFCGQCFARNRKHTAYKDLREHPKDQILATFAMSVSEYENTKHITAIVSSTLMRKRKRIFGRELPLDEYFGVLNIDATDHIGAEFLSRVEIIRQIEAFSVIVQEIIA